MNYSMTGAEVILRAVLIFPTVPYRPSSRARARFTSVPRGTGTVPYLLQNMNMVPFRNWRAEVVPKSINFPGLYYWTGVLKFGTSR